MFDTDLQQDLHDKGRELLDGLAVEGVARRVLMAGSPAQALHDLAEEEHASVLVLGMTHIGHVGRVTQGSVPSNLLHGAPCPVLVVPAGHERRPIRTIAVAYDDGLQAKSALEYAERLARAFDARLELIAGFEREYLAGPPMVAAADLDNMLRGDVSERVHAQVEAISGIPVDARVVAGPVAAAIVDAAADADLLVTGSRGYGPRRSVLVGGVSRYLVDNAACPVLVVPRVPEGAPQREGATDSAAQPA